MDNNKIILKEKNFPKLSLLQNNFCKNGYLITDVENKSNLKKLKKYVEQQLSQIVKKKIGLNNLHRFIKYKNINKIRQTLANQINKNNSIRPLFFNMAKKNLSLLVGNELAMQNKAILSIQMPNDDSSVLPMHCDVFAGESPFQVNQWVPLVNSSRSMSMFFLPKKYSFEILRNFDKYRKLGFKEIFKDYKNNLRWLNVPFGKQVFFCSNFFHGNIVNQETLTRWSFNLRYVNLLNSMTTHEKSIFNFYKPITMKPSTKLGIEFKKIEFKKIKNSINFKKIRKKKIRQLKTYVSSRQFGSWRLPVPMQNVILKDYCEKNNLIFNISNNELNLEGSLTVLNNIFDNLVDGQGIVMCSYKMLSQSFNEIVNILKKGVENNVEWHFVFENIVINDKQDLENFIENLIIEDRQRK